ncbi:coatomer epsilon subunit-domain-containing protein [Morchella snyderi]|nr:coatomer epsilon subunit-domain-containing protein [Morchella snyderi]
MDPFSSEGELLAMHTAFFSGQYQAVLDTDTSTLSPSNALPARIYVLRSRIALGDAPSVISELESESNTPDLAAVKAFAEYTTGAKDAAIAAVEALVESAADNATVQVLGAIVLQNEGRSDEALGLLSNHVNSLEAVALTVHLRLSQNRTDLALKEVQAAKRWAQDSLLVNLAEAYLGLRIGGEKYQSAYYVFEELAQAPASSTCRTLVGQAVAELHLGRLEEAEVALQQALDKKADDADALANMLVLATIAGKDVDEWRAKLEATEAAEAHPFLRELREKEELFERAAGKYSAKVGA